MYSSDALQSLNAEAALAAAAKNLQPFIPWDVNEIDAIGIDFLRKIPNIGSLDVSDKWDSLEEVLVDSSGFGAPGEPALTYEGCLEFIKEQATESSSRGFALVGTGQFQVVLGVFEKL